MAFDKKLTKTLKNPLTGEIWFCEDYNRVKYIDGVAFITVTKQIGHERTFLMAKSSLTVIKSDLTY
jgi:predicted GNAT superfamily acetyltransferase